MVSDYKITMEQAEYEMVCYRKVFNFVRLLDQEKLEKLNAEGLLAAEGGQTKKADLCIGHFCQGCVAMEAFYGRQSCASWNLLEMTFIRSWLNIWKLTVILM